MGYGAAWRLAVGVAVALWFGVGAGNAVAQSSATAEGSAAAAGSVTAGYQPRFTGSWMFTNGSLQERSEVRRTIHRMRFPHKAFVGRFVVFRFVGKSGPEAGWASPRKGYVLILLKRGWNRFVVAHEIGHAADFALTSTSTRAAFRATVARNAPRGDCLSSRTTWKRRYARMHSCRHKEEWASAFARAYCCGEPSVGVEGRRLTRQLFRSFARRRLRPEDTAVTQRVKVACYYPQRMVVGRVLPEECQRDQGMLNPRLVMCSYPSAGGHLVTLRLELSDCQSRIIASGG